MRARKHLLIIKAIIKKKIWRCWHAKYVGGYSIAIHINDDDGDYGDNNNNNNNIVYSENPMHK